MMGENIVVVSGLSKKFCRNFKRSLWYGLQDISSELIGRERYRAKLRNDEFWALKNINLELKQGELIGLIGPNGAGKTTFLKLLTGLIRPDEGEITIRGKIRALIALGAGFNPVLTARENIYINGAILGASKKEMDSLLGEIVEFSELEKFLDMPVQNYSSGMLVRLGFSIAVNIHPDILIVDEVLAVGDAAFRRKARNKMMGLLHSGISVIFVSHNISLVSALTSRCLYIDQGEIVDIGPTERVTSRYLNDSIKKSGDEDESSEDFLMASAFLTTPDFVLKDVKLMNLDGVETNDFITYQDIKVSFEVEFLKSFKDVFIAISVRSQLDDVVIAFNRIPEKKNFEAGMANIECCILKNRFNEGCYKIGFYVTTLSNEALFKSNRAKSFNILADMETFERSRSSHGYTVIDTEWDFL
ncbi:MAG: ABC transporter ATP-binding protein [Candidatus Aminicenantes bacterium]|nr:MAG: ABC transporter ATP-binding protein [Candidatus Aminicenantes bacterium]